MANWDVFISFPSPERDAARALRDALVEDGKTVFIDEAGLTAGRVWSEQLLAELRASRMVVVLLSRHSVDAHYQRAEIEKAIEHWRDHKTDYRVVPALLESPDGWDPHLGLAPLQQLDWISMEDPDERAARLARLLDEPNPDPPPGIERFEKRIDITQIPYTGVGSELFGRDDELRMLSEAWADAGTRIVSLVAWGGVGKTAIVSRWLHDQAAADWPGVARAFAWSFFSQGAAEDKQASADPFISKALQFFGDEDPTVGDAWQKADRLAGLIREAPTLLILDGMEPLQYPPGKAGLGGQLRDEGLAQLLKQLAGGMRGLCLVTTRLAVKQLDRAVGSTVLRHDLAQLKPEAGAALLRARGVEGSEKELRDASESLGGHALAISLLGSMLNRYCGGDVRQRDVLPDLRHDPEQGGHARQVLEAYERWLAEDDQATAEEQVLRLMGLFDRPADAGAVAALREPPVIAGLTDAIADLDRFAWQDTLTALGKAGLVRADDEGTLDAHPLVREHFAERLQDEAPEAQREAHGRLFDYFLGIPSKEQPDTLEEMEPLFQAIAHGCASGRYEEALRAYYGRIQRDGTINYCCASLGAYGSDLATLAHFFTEPWGELAPALRGGARAAVVGWAGFRLRAVGRLSEAVEPMEAALRIATAEEHWLNAAIGAGNLAELLQDLGRLDAEDGAEARARQALVLAERSEQKGQRVICLAQIGDALHQAGQLDEAARSFAESERLTIELQPSLPFLYSRRGFAYCDLLLTRGENAEARRRAKQSLALARKARWLLDMAFNHLILGLSRLAEALENGEDAVAESLAEAEGHLDRSVTGFLEAGALHHQPRGFLGRAVLRRALHAGTGDPGRLESAAEDLGAARELCERGGMRLHLTDCDLEGARIALACGDEESRREARKLYDRAAKAVAEMGYHRRDPELAELAAALGVTPPPASAD